MAQRKLVTSTSLEAHKLATKLQAFRPGRQFEIYGVSFGYQVVEIRRFAGFGYSWDGTRWTKQARKPAATSVAQLPAAPQPGLTVQVELPFSQESKAFIGAIQDGVVRWFGKTTLIDYEVAGDKVRMTMPAKVAAKRGLAA